MKSFVMTAAALVVGWPMMQIPAHADSLAGRLLADDDWQERHDVERYGESPEHRDIERQENKIAHDRAEMRREGREGDVAGVRREEREITREENRIDRDREGMSGSSVAPYGSRHHDDD